VDKLSTFNDATAVCFIYVLNRCRGHAFDHIRLPQRVGLKQDWIPNDGVAEHIDVRFPILEQP
jgi:hypothetical protein